MPGSTNAVSSSPPIASKSTCSPTDGAHHTRERPARQVSQFSQVVSIPPVWTRQSPSSWSMSVTMPVRIRLRIARAISCREFKLFIGKGCRRARSVAIERGVVGDETTMSHPKRSQFDTLYLYKTFPKRNYGKRSKIICFYFL